MNLLYFKLAIRYILKNKLYSLINVIGLSIGITTVLFIFLFVRFETSFDNFYPDVKNTYRIIETYDTKDDHYISGFSRYPDAPEIKNSIAGVEDYCRVSDAGPVKCFIENKLFKIDRFRFTDDNFCNFFGIHLLAGDPVTALDAADKIILTRSTAVRLFGNEDPLGKPISCMQKIFTVTGIMEDLPLNTHLKSDVFASIKYVEEDKENFWLGWGGGMEFLSYLRLSEGISPEQIEKSLPGLVYEKFNKNNEGIGFKLSLNLQNIRKVHLTRGEGRYDCSDNRSMTGIMLVAGVGLLILILAIVNYISLYLAQKAARTKDVSLLSVHGAGRSEIFVQSFAEVFLISVISSVIAVNLFSIVTPILNNYLLTSVTLKGNIISSLIFLFILIILLSGLITILSAHGFSRNRFRTVFRDVYIPELSRSFPGNVLVILQFIIVIILIITVLTINRQNKYLMNMEMGFTSENILSVFTDKEYKNNELNIFKQELLKMPEIKNVSLTSQGVGTGLTMNGYRITGEDGLTMLNVVYTDAEFLDCFDIKLAEGRNFKTGVTTDNNSILVNRKLVQRTGWGDPLNRTIDRNGLLTVIGVVEDFNFASLYSEINPLIIMCDPAYDSWGYNCVNVKYHTTDIQSLIKKISGLWEKEYPGVTYEISFLEDQLAGNYESLVAQQKIVTFFSILAVVIACMGLFGISSFVARRRIKEIGIRRINGAKITELVLMLNTNFLKWILVSVIVAIPLSIFISYKWLQGFAYKTELSIWIFITGCFIVLIISLLAVTWQSLRAATRNPVEALRYE